MSRQHLDAFKADLLKINPKFRKMTSSLRGLVRHMESTVTMPQSMSYDQALRHCLRSSNSSLQKYEPAVLRLVSVWGHRPARPYPRISPGHTLRQVDINRICFRGDSRGPEEIFATGFVPRRENSNPEYRKGTITNVSEADPYRHPIEGFRRAGDIEPASAVCITPDMHVASLFPLPDPDNFGANIWIYMLYLTQGVNTNSRQVLDALAGLSELKEYENSEGWDPSNAKNASAAQAHQIRVSEIAVNLYGRELASKTIPASSVWAAFQIQRTWSSVKTWKSPLDNSIRNKADYSKGGSYRIAEIRNNEQAIINNEELKHAKRRFLTAMQTKRGPYQMPTHEQGFHPSNVKALS